MVRNHLHSILAIAVIAFAAHRPLLAQMESPGCRDECRINSNLAGVINVPLNPTAQLANVGGGIVGGVGYNFNKKNAFVGEFMWNRVDPDVNVSQVLRTALQASDLKLYTDFFVLTANYRYELRGQFFGAYLIGGGGAYIRYTHLSRSVTIFSSGTPCTTPWLWWGFSCAAGFVSASQTLVSSTTSALGANAGGGMTFRVGDPPYRIYAEARYHYAPTSPLNTKFVAVAFGLRF